MGRGAQTGLAHLGWVLLLLSGDPKAWFVFSLRVDSGQVAFLLCALCSMSVPRVCGAQGTSLETCLKEK